MTLLREFNLHINAGYGLPLIINVNQYDSGEKWIFTLYKTDGTRYIPTSGAIVGIKSDNFGVINSGTVNSNGQVEIIETQQMTAAPGKAIFELLLDNGTHGTANFIVLVEPKPGDKAELSSSDLSMIQEAINATIPENIAGAVQDWMDENLDTSNVIDSTLSISGAAADAKVTGDELNDVKSQISSKTGLSDAIKNALKLLADTVAYENTEVGITTRNAVYSALDAVNVVSLSATYEQSDSIYTHNELDDLRQYLTVTATYDNGMSSQISTYTLVGELTAGTPVITVEYEGETATFTPTVYESVPSTYQIYDFIKSTKQSGAVNTNYWILLKQFDDLNALNFRFKLKPTNDSSTSTIFGARVDSLANSVAVYLNATTDGSRQLVIVAEDWQSTGIFLPLNEVATVVCENPSVSPSRVKVNNGEWVELPWASTVTEKQVLNLAPMLFNNPLNSSTSLKIFPNQELGHLEFFNYSGTRVGDYFPVKRVSDNVVGMYDVVENVFYTTKTAAYATIGNSSCIYAVGNWG